MNMTELYGIALVLAKHCKSVNKQIYARLIKTWSKKRAVIVIS